MSHTPIKRNALAPLAYQVGMIVVRVFIDDFEPNILENCRYFSKIRSHLAKCSYLSVTLALESGEDPKTLNRDKP